MIKDLRMKSTSVSFMLSSLILVLSAIFIFGNAMAQKHVKENKAITIVFIGNSITYGATLAHPETEAPPVHAVAYLRQRPAMGEVHFSNQGVGGFTTVDFLPTTATFKNVIEATNKIYKNKQATLIFSIMLGTNDSAIKGPNGSPVSPKHYRDNLKAIIDKLLYYYPASRIIINRPIWYSTNTHNSAEYLQEGLTRLQSYFPEIDTLTEAYATSNPHQVMEGDTKAFRYFKDHYKKYLTPQQGHQGIFYLHPNKEGAEKLGIFWGKAIYKMLRHAD